MGAEGDAVGDLQQRLARLGHPVPPEESGRFRRATSDAVQAFQAARGLRADGICGEQTWSVLVEAGYRLGDRLLYLRQPMLRGDDVATLQLSLGALGFDAGRIDGIFGPHTKAAVEDFQRNAALTIDSVCGADTRRALERFGARVAARQPVAEVRELERLRSSPRTLRLRRVVIGDAGGMHAAAAATRQVLLGAGATVTVLGHPDQSEQAAEANAGQAEVYLGLALDPSESGCWAAYYAGQRFESPAGRRLAELVHSTVTTALELGGGGVRGMALPVLRETRMAAVVCELGPPPLVVARTAELAQALADALASWALAPLPGLDLDQANDSRRRT
ncbi:MAG: peptidoglycan-binding protein [Acidimicrobiales bacterium]